MIRRSVKAMIVRIRRSFNAMIPSRVLVRSKTFNEVIAIVFLGIGLSLVTSEVDAISTNGPVTKPTESVLQNIVREVAHCGRFPGGVLLTIGGICFLRVNWLLADFKERAERAREEEKAQGNQNPSGLVGPGINLDVVAYLDGSDVEKAKVGLTFCIGNICLLVGLFLILLYRFCR